MADNNQQVDGIRQLSETEKKQSREIVLETIGEQENENLADTNQNKKVDGIFGFITGKNKESVQTQAKPDQPPISKDQQRAWKEEINKIVPPVSEMKAVPEIKKEVQTPNFLVNMAPPVSEPIVRAIVPKAVVNEKKEDATSKPVKEKTIEKKVDKKIDKKIKKEVKPVILKKIPHSKFGLQARKRSLARSHFRKDFSFRDWFGGDLKDFEIRINIAVRKALVYFASFVVMVFMVYWLFVLFIIKTNADSPILRTISKWIVIPAIITNDGVIDFFQYKDFKEQQGLSNEEAKVGIIKAMITDNLYQKLNLPRDKDINEVAKLVVYSQEVNKVPLERMKKIDELIKQGESFDEIVKYSDDSGQVSLTSANKDDYSFSNDVMNMTPNQVSDIIYTAEGYYIFKSLARSDEQEDLRYVYIRAKDFQGYIDEIENNYKYISLVK
jgi:hypothetical protein